MRKNQACESSETLEPKPIPAPEPPCSLTRGRGSAFSRPCPYQPLSKPPKNALKPPSKPPKRRTELPYEPPTFDFQHAASSPEQELAQRELCRRRLPPFIQRFRPKYNAGWVHADICRRLERFMRQVERGEEPRLLLMCPPRSGKSEIGSRHFAPWMLGQHPDWGNHRRKPHVIPVDELFAVHP